MICGSIIPAERYKFGLAAAFTFLTIRSFMFTAYALLDLRYTFDESSLGFNATTSKSQISNYKLQVILHYEFSIDTHVTLFLWGKKVNVGISLTQRRLLIFFLVTR